MDLLLFIVRLDCYNIVQGAYTEVASSSQFLGLSVNRNSFSFARARDRCEQLYFSSSVISAKLR